MKKAITSLLLLLAAGTVSAQNFSGGLRAGLNCQSAIDNNLKSHGHLTTFQKEAFVRFETKGKWAFEVSGGHEQYKNASHSRTFHVIDNFSGEGMGGPMWETTGINRTAYTVSIKAEYEMSCGQSAHCPLMRRFKNYIGLVAGPSFVHHKTSMMQETVSGASTLHRYDDHSVQLWAGLSNTLQYALSGNLFISGNLNYQVNVADGTLFSPLFAGQLTGYYEPNNRFTGTLGIGYKF